MIGEADREIRLRTFDWLTRQRDELGEAISRTVLETFSLDGRRIPTRRAIGDLEAGRMRAPVVDHDDGRWSV